MRVNYRTNQSTWFRVLSDDQLEELQRAVLHVMEHIGLDVHHEGARELLEENGAYVDGLRVRIPAYMVERALSTAPRSFTVFSREGDPQKDIHIGPGRVYYGPGPTCPYFRDPHTGEKRIYTRADAAAVAKACDALPNIDFVESLGTVGDVPSELADTYEFAEMFPNTGKPIVAWSYGLSGAEDIHKMALAEAGGQRAFQKKPNYIHYCEPLSPLVGGEEAMDKAIFSAKHRIPLIFTPCPIGGGTAPCTLAGVLVQAASESWLGLVISQLISPGTPFVMGGVVSIMDMKSMVLAYGAPELSLLSAGLTELAHYVGLPLWSTGGCTDSKVFDEQAALEGTMSVLFSALSGGDLVHDVGYLEGAMTGSLQQLVMMDESIGLVRRIVRGIEVNDETLALGVIEKVGPGGHYLSEEHTLRHFKTDFWFPKLMDRQRWGDWELMGKKRMRDRVQERLDKILASHEPTPVSEETKKTIKEVLAAAEQRVSD
ncbi:MAG: trimethylamine methyltransferase family protein [Anaerolineae bacterium]